MIEWDERFLALAELVAGWSKDPSTCTGCVLVLPDRTVAGLGYNGFPRNVRDTVERLNDRPTKYAMTVHAETNAILTARGSLAGCYAYVWPWPPCAPCTAALLQAGITRIVAPTPTPAQVERWGDSFIHARAMMADAGVELQLMGAV